MNRNADTFFYVKQGNASKVDTINDRANFREVVSSLNTLQFTKEEQETLWRVIAAILHLGNLEFETDEEKLRLKNGKVAECAADLLQVSNKIYCVLIIYIFLIFRCLKTN